MSKTILFVSSNNTWGGSEILWSETAALLIQKGYRVYFGVKYQNAVIHSLTNKGASYINLNNTTTPSIVQRVLRRIKVKEQPKEVFLQNVLELKPHLVVLSQGNNVDGNYYMTICRQLAVPYVTITQLVTNILWVYINDIIIDELRKNYEHAVMNYFVSQANIDLHNLMLGDELPNSKVAYNSFTVPVDISFTYPVVQKGIYKIALVGRLETFHKGQDLLLEVLNQQKWRDRPIVFSFYGAGPHQLLLERLVKKYKIKNVIFQGHVTEVASIWQTNHLLILPSRMEGQSLALIEAMWCYRSAVVTDVGGAKELLTEDENGFIADFATFNDLDKALEKAWQARDRWEVMGQNAGNKIRELYKEQPVESFSNELIKIVAEAK